MISHLHIGIADIYITPFDSEELAAGQTAGQRMAVERLLEHAVPGHGQLLHHDDGAPYIASETREISISHCHGIAALAVGNDSRFGIDIETQRPTLRRVARKFLSAEELTRVTADTALLAAWTIKEALYKAAGKAGVDFARDVRLPLPGSDTGHVLDRAFRVATVAVEGAMLSIAWPV